MIYEIIDFHTHPFIRGADNICKYKVNSGMTADTTIDYLRGLGIKRICGSVLCQNKDEVEYGSQWDCIVESNRQALALKEYYNGFYIPGFHVHPDYVRESCDEIERMSKLGIKLIGELVPRAYGWCDYSSRAFDEILDTAAQYQMVVNFHSLNDDNMDAMVRRHPDTILVAAHPGEYESYMRHLNRMKMSDNYYLDLSGTGLFRHRMLRWGIDQYGAHRFIFGSDYPTCSPAMFIGAILLDTNLSENEKFQIFSGNAKRLLKID